MEIRVRELVAKCRGCGSSTFQPTDGRDASAMDTILACAQCGRRSTRGELVARLADEALQRSREARLAMNRPTKRD